MIGDAEGRGTVLKPTAATHPIFVPEVFDALDQRAAEFQQARPFKHVVVDGLFREDFLREVAAEFYPPGDRRWHRFKDKSRQVKLMLQSEYELPPRVRELTRELNAEPFLRKLAALTGIGGVDKALLEGRIAAHAIAGDETSAQALASSHARAMAFVERLEAAFSLRPELLQLAEASTIVCRCEDVTLAAVKNAFSGRDAKLQSRCGMGVCQGRVCGPVLQRLIGAESPQVRPPVFTTRIATLARAPAMASRGDA